MPRHTYTPEEYANMHLIYGLCNCNANEAAREYRRRYPDLRHPDYRVFTRVHIAFSEGRMPGTGVGGASEGRPRRHRDDEVLEAVRANPELSIRELSRGTGVDTRTVGRILHRHELHPYHYQRVQTLMTRDYEPRVQFCRVMLRKIREDSAFFDKILWSDESSCKRNGYVNMHNLHSWQATNPRNIRQDRAQVQFKVNLWTGILNGQIVGPVELSETLTGPNYLNFLQNTLPELLQSLNVPENYWLQNDGCPAHYARIVRNYLNDEYNERWIGRLGPILWPPRSPDLNPLDFFYWGCLKEKVYKKEIASLEQLKALIFEAADEIKRSGFIRRLKRSFIRRCRACIAAGGRHFEHFL